jgi:predicted DCC family thiol-disulfide oxidoreductase YuxK
VTNIWPDDDVILYDGVCVFCSRWIRFIAARDVARRFRFTAIQSGYGTRLAQAFGIDPDDPDTNAVIHGGVAYFKSDAALTVLGALPGWSWVRVLRAVPKPLRNAVYNLVARGTGFSGSMRSAFCRTRSLGRGWWSRFIRSSWRANESVRSAAR